MGAVKKRCRPFRDMSLRASYVVYTVLVFLGCTLACSLIINMADSARMRLQNQYLQQGESYAIPKGGYYTITYGIPWSLPSMTRTTCAGRPSRWTTAAPRPMWIRRGWSSP